ncbi:hypothetical protein ACLB2K_071298 [Fragaria x ananassa]
MGRTRIMGATLLVWFLIIATTSISLCNGNPGVACKESERLALLMLKQDLTDPSNRLSSWAGESDCCQWTGVVCDNLTGHIRELQLDDPYFNSSLGGKDVERGTFSHRHAVLHDQLVKQRLQILIPGAFSNVKPEILKNVTALPENFKPHRAVKKVYGERAQMIETGEGIDWAVGEALAFATLLVEGNHVRLSGKDVERGTFSHRHAVLHDQETGERYCPLDHVIANQDEEMFTVSNSGESKWLRQTGLVLLLPHGYDGQGPEHSSARLERFLQMSDDNPYVIPEMDPTLRKQIRECNWQVVNVTLLLIISMSFVVREFHKPLVVMAPKNLLWHKDCKSNLSEFDDVQGHPDAEIVWCQEEPMNMGAYNCIAPGLCTAMKSLSRGTIDDIKYIGRAPSAATATGFYQFHLKEQADIVHKSVQLEPID